MSEYNPLAVAKALALVETALRSIKGRDAVCRQTGGNAPEIVQGILDRIGEQWERIRELEAQRDDLLAALDEMLNRGGRLIENDGRAYIVVPHEDALAVARAAIAKATG